MVVMLSVCLLFVVSAGTACTYGSDAECMFPCHCEEDGECDEETGECLSGQCPDGIPAGLGFRWSGPGCRIG